MEELVYNIICNDELYGVFDRPMKDDLQYMAQVSETAVDRMRATLPNQMLNAEMKLYKMPIRQQHFEVWLNI